MRFEAFFSPAWVSNGKLVYRANEYSFDIEPHPPNFTSVLVNDLNLEVDSGARVVSVWGYCPYQGWKPSFISPPVSASGELFFVSDKVLSGGVSLRLDKANWPIFFDSSSGWVFLNSGRSHDISVKLFDGVIVGIENEGQLSGIWLKPDRLPAQLSA